MRGGMRSGLCVLVVSVLLTSGAGRADAGLITLTFGGLGTGVLDPFGSRIQFTDTAFTITAVADTARPFPVVRPGIVELFNASVTIAIAGVGTATVPELSTSFVNSNGATGTAGVGFLDSGEFFIVRDPAFKTYQLDGPLGPIPVAGFGTEFQAPTSLGLLEFFSATGLTFQAATPAAVPEPSSAALCGIAGVVGLAVVRARRKRAPAPGGFALS